MYSTVADVWYDSVDDEKKTAHTHDTIVENTPIETMYEK
jgi:hypothetical protein